MCTVQQNSVSHANRNFATQETSSVMARMFISPSSLGIRQGMLINTTSYPDLSN
jgi:hypothetical protein